MRSVRRLRWLILSGLAALPLLAGAQTPQAPQAAASQPQGALQSVIVTAQKRSQNAQQVGVAVSTLSGDELTARGVRKVNSLQNEVPSLEVEPAFGGGQAQFRLRGVGFQDYATNNAGAVTVYVDEVALPLPVQTQGLLFDLDRVEVLRGPQGTLYGRNTTGGAVNFITRGPTARFEGGAMVGLGSFGAREAEGFVSGPLSDSLRGRIAISTQRGGAWQRNRVTGEKLGDKDIVGVRGQLELLASRDLRVLLSLNHGTDKSEGQGLYAFVTQPAVPAYPVPKPALPADTDIRNTGWGFDPAFLAATGNAAGAKPGRDNSASGAALTVNWDLGDLRLTSITASDRFRRKELADYDATSLPLAETFFASRSRNLSQELRIASNQKDASVNWLAGLYFADEKLDEAYWSSFTGSFGFPTVRTAYTQKVRTGSVFGQGDMRLAPDLKLVLGLRQERERRERENFVTESLAPAIVFTGPTSGSFSNNQTSGKAALEYQASKEMLAYGSISRGIKSGGFTAYNTFNAAALTPFKPEVLIAYELGMKSDPSPQLRFNAAVFHYNYRNQQILDAIVDPGTGATVGTITNAPKSQIQGIELDVAYKPSPALTLTGFLGYKDGEFKEYVARLPAADLKGQSLYFPRLSYGLGATYRGAIGGWGFVAQADASFHDKGRTFLNRINPAYDFATPSYWLANARVEFAPLDAKWVATVYARNLFNENYDLTRNFFDLPLPVAAAGAPRSVGVQVKFDF
jgi:outer membrane receptor protein involved in Fe transport